MEDPVPCYLVSHQRVNTTLMFLWCSVLSRVVCTLASLLLAAPQPRQHWSQHNTFNTPRDEEVTQHMPICEGAT